MANPTSSKLWPGLVFVVLGCLIVCCSAADYHRMQDKFDWVDRSCRGREDAFDEAWEEYRALATEGNNAVKARRPMPATESMLETMFQVQPNPRSNSFLDVKDNFERMKGFGSTGKSTGLYLWCDDSAFDYVDKYEDGPNEGKALPADDRHWIIRRGPKGKKLSWLSRQRDVFCSESRGHGNWAFTLWEIKVVVLCPVLWEELAPSWLCEERDRHSSRTSLNSMKTIGTTIYHELVHARLRTTPDYAADFGPCKQLAKDHRDLAKINPDSLTLFAMAMLYRENDWSSGYARSLPRE